MKSVALVISFLSALGAFGQADAASSNPDIQDPAQLVGKRVNVQRMPLCRPESYTVDLEHSGKQAVVVSARAKGISIPSSAMSRLSPEVKELMLDQQKAALLLFQFDDGVQLDSCAAIGPKKLSEYLELAPGESLSQPSTPGETEKGAAVPVAEIDELTPSEVSAALSGSGKDHWVEIQDMGLMSVQGSQVPSISLYMPEAILAMRSETARKQFLKYEPTEEDRQRAFTVVAKGFVGKTVKDGCASVTRIVLLSDPEGRLVKEPYKSEPIEETWRNSYGATNVCASLRAQFLMDDVLLVRKAAADGEFYVAVFSGSVKTKVYKVKKKHQAKLALE